MPASERRSSVAAGSIAESSTSDSAEKAAVSCKVQSLSSHWKRPVRSAFQNSGQICLCGSRILVERGIYNEFRDALVERALALRIGDPMDPDARMGPLVSQAHFDKVAAAIARAREEGGHVLCGGNALDRPGWFVAPTVIEGLAL